jgi:hypothetical protein
MASAITLFRLSCLVTTLAAGLVLADSHSASARGGSMSGSRGGFQSGARSPHIVNTIHPIIAGKGHRMGRKDRDRDRDRDYSKSKGKNNPRPVGQLPSGGSTPAKIPVTVTIVRDHRPSPIIRDHR